MVAALGGALPGTAWADHFEQTISTDCDRTANRLNIVRHGAYDEKGDQLVRNLRANQWNLRDLLLGNSLAVTGTKRIQVTCVLAAATYVVTVPAVTWNRYGSDETADVTVISGDRTFFDGDLQGTPFTEAPNRPVISRIVVASGVPQAEVIWAKNSTDY
jgi:hypothetical protein